MDAQANVFKDDAINGISISIQNLLHQEAEEKSSNLGVVHKITKYNPLFRSLTNNLDLIFSFGLKDAKKGYWPLVKKIAHSCVISMVEEHQEATSDIKKGYIWLFLTFIENSLGGYVRMMISNEKLLRTFYKPYALLHDSERCEILLNLLIGIEALNFSIDFDDPYLDYGHDPILRQEKVVIRIDSPAFKRISYADDKKEPLSQQPDVTIHHHTKSATYPDLLEAPQNILVHQSGGTSQELEYSGNSSLKWENEIDLGKNSCTGVADLSGSYELEDDNYIPEISCSPGYSLLVGEDVASMLRADEGECLQMSIVGAVSPDSHSGSSLNQGGDSSKLEYSEEEHKTSPVVGDNNNKSPDPQVTEAIKNLAACESDNYCITYMSDIEDTSECVSADASGCENVFDVENLPEESGDEDENSEAENIDTSSHTDSFDGFCREVRGVSTCSDDSSEWLQPHSSSLAEITPLRISNSYAPRLSMHRLSDSRHNTSIGFLLPTLPRRPDLKEALQRYDEIELDQSEQILLTLEIFNRPTEMPVRMFEVCIGSLVGFKCIRYLLVSTMSIYLLEKKDAVHSGYVSMLSIDTDSVTKVQTSLNFQDVYIVHDNGCFHVSTGDEVVTRSILSTIKSVMKSGKYVDVAAEQPMADNTNNELDLIIKDWLICHTGVEEPEIVYFGLIQLALLSNENDGRVLKSGIASSRTVLIAGVKTPWDSGRFLLRGHMLYKYNSRELAQGNDLKSVYNLKKKVGGCVHSGTDGHRFTFKLLARDGSSTLVELGVDTESEANDWVMTICKVVADAKNEHEGTRSFETSLIHCGLVMTFEKVYFFNQDAKSGRLTLEDTCAIADISQVCIDNENRTYCTFILDHNIESDEEADSSNVSWLLKFSSEYELGKFEQHLYGVWQTLYQVSLQFVLLNDMALKERIRMLTSQHNIKDGHITQQLLMQLINN